MYYCCKRSRGILEKVPAKSIVFHRDCSHERMLEKCKSIYSDEELKGAEFYIADSRGAAICSTIQLDSDGNDKEVTWTLSRYMSLSNMKFPSKARFYCVRKGKRSFTLHSRIKCSTLAICMHGILTKCCLRLGFDIPTYTNFF